MDGLSVFGDRVVLIILQVLLRRKEATGGYHDRPLSARALGER